MGLCGSCLFDDCDQFENFLLLWKEEIQFLIWFYAKAFGVHFGVQAEIDSEHVQLENKMFWITAADRLSG